MKDILSIIKCPVCRDELTRIEKSLVCRSKHTFDIAKSGYVNMLPPGKEKNARTGDERDMVKARVDFLSLGYYGRISETLASLLVPYAPDGDITFADMGCGEGWHTVRIAQKMAQEMPEHDILAVGFDASKYAAECASRLARSKGLSPKDGIGADFEGNAVYFMPANIFSLPLCDSSVDFAVSMFAPVAGDEAHRILRPGGVLAVVSSGKDHLLEMRETIYDDVRLSDSLPETPRGFRCAEQSSLKYTVTLKNTYEIGSLFIMTPFYYKTTDAGRTRLLAKDSLDVTVNVNYTLFEAV